MRIVVLSDTHLRHGGIAVPAGDVLIHCGDATMKGTFQEIAFFNAWLGTLPHQVKFFCAGNHDWLFATAPDLARSLLSNAVYLEDRLVELEGLAIYASPWQPRFNNWAFNLDPDELRAKWERIPSGIDILITHGPPYGILDPGMDPGGGAVHAGDQGLLEAVQRIKPRYHLFGHLHGGYGVLEQDGTTFVNAALINDRYALCARRPIVLDVTA